MTTSTTRAIVLGASMGGLLAARVLSESFDEVRVIERDTLPGAPATRRGVPQGRHTHGLLAAGRQVLEELFPGFTAEVVAAGALLGDVQADCRWYNDGHLLRQRRSGMEVLALSRPLLEHHVRQRVRQLPQVDIVAPADVLELTADHGTVTGVRIRRSGTDTAELLAADLVVDASGRGSHMPVWLEQLGFRRPAESTIEIGLGYTTWEFPRRPGDFAGDLAVVIGATPGRPRFGVAVAQEGDRWIVTAGGYRGDHAPTDRDAFAQFVATLPSGELADLVTSREPLGPPRRYRFQGSVRRHYERLAAFPGRLLVLGDALCSFNPAYGQGMSVAAMEAMELRSVLRSVPVASPDLARQFHRRAARVIDIPWDMAAGGDLRIPVVPGPRPLRTRLVNAYVAQVQAAAARDATIGEAFLRVANLVRRPESLLSPATAARVAAARLGTHRRVITTPPARLSPQTAS